MFLVTEMRTCLPGRISFFSLHYSVSSRTNCRARGRCCGCGSRPVGLWQRSRFS